MTAVSIVIAFHDAGKYARRFVASLHSQTLSDFEAIFVDDASTDGGAAIIEGLAARDPRLRLIRLPRNLGAGAARNAGIRAARGRTLCFADPDDLLPETSLQVRYEAFRAHQAIVRACHDEALDTGEMLNHETRPQGLPAVCQPREEARRIGVNPFVCAHWTWLFPTKMIQRLGVTNEEELRTAEDIIFLARLFFHIDKLVWIPDTVYYWLKRRDSLSNTVYTAEHYFDYLKCVDIFYDEAKAHKGLALADSFCDQYLACYLSHLLTQVIDGKSGEEDVRRVVGEALRICSKSGVLERRLGAVRAAPLRHPGLFRLWMAVTDTDPSMVNRLAKGQNVLGSLYQTAMRAAGASGAPGGPGGQGGPGEQDGERA